MLAHLMWLKIMGYKIIAFILEDLERADWFETK